MTGYNIKVRFGYGGSAGLIMRVRKVSTDGDVGEIDETDSESGGYGDCDDSGVAQRSVTFEGFVRAADAAPPVEGDLLTNVLIAWDGNVAAPNVNKREFFNKLKILKAARDGEVRGGSISYTLTCKSSGPYKPMGIA